MHMSRSVVIRVNDHPETVYRINGWHPSTNLSGLVIYLRGRVIQPQLAAVDRFGAVGEFFPALRVGEMLAQTGAFIVGHGSDAHDRNGALAKILQIVVPCASAEAAIALVGIVLWQGVANFLFFNAPFKPNATAIDTFNGIKKFDPGVLKGASEVF